MISGMRSAIVQTGKLGVYLRMSLNRLRKVVTKGVKKRCETEGLV